MRTNTLLHARTYTHMRALTCVHTLPARREPGQRCAHRDILRKRGSVPACDTICDTSLRFPPSISSTLSSADDVLCQQVSGCAECKYSADSMIFTWVKIYPRTCTHTRRRTHHSHNRFETEENLRNSDQKLARDLHCIQEILVVSFLLILLSLLLSYFLAKRVRVRS